MTTRQFLQAPQQRIAAPGAGASWPVTSPGAIDFCPVITCLIELA
jgi:hypothetical protein